MEEILGPYLLPV